MTGLVTLYKRMTEKLGGIPFPDLSLGARLAIAWPFYSSGRTKAGEGFLELNDFTVSLFEDEYQVPFLDPELAATLSLYAETFFPIMLLIGLGTRFASAGLLGVILVITVSYPSHNWMESVSWGVGLFAILFCGGGRYSLDNVLNKVIARN